TSQRAAPTAFEFAVLAFFPPAVLLLVIRLIAKAWNKLAKLYWVTLPSNVRKGLLRLYVATAVPWPTYFGYHILHYMTNYPSYRVWHHASGSFWTLLIVPIGGPALLLVGAWVVAGFRFSLSKENRDHLHLPSDYTQAGKALGKSFFEPD